MIKLGLVVGLSFFSVNGFSVDIDVHTNLVKDCYADDNASHALYQGAAMLNDTLPINCDGDKERSISRDTKLLALRVAVVGKDKDGYNIIKHNDIVVNKPAGSIKDYLPGNINNNTGLRKKLRYLKVTDRDEIRVLSHYVDHFVQEQPKKNVHSIGYRPIQRPKDSKPSSSLICQYRNGPPMLIYRKNLCKQSNKEVN